MGIPALSQATEQVKKVENAISLAKGKWLSAGISLGSFFGISPKAQVLGGIASIERVALEEWAPRRFKIAASDQKSWDRWVADGNDILKNLADIAQDSKVSSLQGVIAATLVQTAKDTKQAAIVGVTAALGLSKWLVIGVVAAAAIYLTFKIKK